jgi:hypothetical protein
VRASSDLVNSIPPSQRVRDRLGEVVREARLLRQLLKVAERAERRQQDQSRRDVAEAIGLGSRPSLPTIRHVLPKETSHSNGAPVCAGGAS